MLTQEVPSPVASFVRPLVGDPFAPRPAARLLARARGPWLDGALMAGADPSGSAVLAARAATLGSRRARRALARAVDGIVRSAHRPPNRVQLSPCRQAVLANESTLQDLAAGLRGDAPVYVRGVARLGALLSDGSGPVYDGDADALAEQLDVVAAELAGATDTVGPITPKKLIPRDPPAVRLRGTVAPRAGSWAHPRREAS
jgi:hypothetical protein